MKYIVGQAITIAATTAPMKFRTVISKAEFKLVKKIVDPNAD